MGNNLESYQKDLEGSSENEPFEKKVHFFFITVTYDPRDILPNRVRFEIEKDYFRILTFGGKHIESHGWDSVRDWSGCKNKLRIRISNTNIFFQTNSAEKIHHELQFFKRHHNQWLEQNEKERQEKTKIHEKILEQQNYNELEQQLKETDKNK
ncbi:hypothetical protein M0813_26913 [Anaeramoeba flamelloides]|uniref:Uncharacterized protein n=1 Tax=Anaeramoeba flamelloides TaxID=1746091 RepID=A0AAV8A1P8_9EUKA|nr:hypothetical protein M0812_07719 [Anaeramoeba flamelloides]KAJ6237355.1 hypothetical protein M0813_26913 [Anaeramoeba flamelloides]